MQHKICSQFPGKGRFPACRERKGDALMKTKPISPKTISPALWGGLACLVLALVLELLPTGVVLMFADGPGQQIPQSFS